ncbi:amidohydrolase family protein [Pseudonocardia sp. KRD-184]|uniref:Amidohydrolase family protein n=1 Tax=Pseudonocardia oceani TaxID=2792013 RepID=A0ABS6UBW8_9PSEU|nr:amidohydrolase family protein [Pseudonocardia oceani]MBW0089515.1 amidohydrolase family protein [Pseudonocardia oceani]MBW0096525.1 amidohydrolase family protein [Pseudonocardia oceani]MBW0109231.1 amidohydrolase family protein [Pseudonocardia oceani]MBW0119853.1 amidohydrolase family protein [Pseudonocardia oceani]MBW0129416.1 amidohydrolase family protein [Pseudonocardia oceani]
MYVVDGETYLVVDAQVHAWDASPHNQAGPAGELFAADLLRRHRELDGSAVPLPEVERVTEDGLSRDVFGGGCVDRAVLQPVVLGELFVLGFSPVAWHAELAARMPGKFVLSGELDPDAGQPGARGIAAKVRRWDMRGLTFCESRRPGGRMELRETWLRRALARCAASGAGVVHLGVTPSAGPAPWRRWRAAAGQRRPGGTPPRLPSWAEPVRSGSALPVRTRPVQRVASAGFDVAQFRELATALPRTSFVLGAGCLPADQLCRLARLPNVHVVLTDILPWISATDARADFGRALGELLIAYGPERLLFGSGYPLVRPGRLVAQFASYRFPDELRGRYRDLDADARRAILGGNAARLYGIEGGRMAPSVSVRQG